MINQLPSSMQAHMDEYQRTHLPELTKYLPTSPALPWFISIFGWYINQTRQAATSLKVLEAAGVDMETAALLVARQLRSEIEDTYQRLYATHRRDSFPTVMESQTESEYREMVFRLGLFISWLNDLEKQA